MCIRSNTMTINEKIRLLSEITGINLFDEPKIRKQVYNLLKDSGDDEPDTEQAEQLDEQHDDENGAGVESETVTDSDNGDKDTDANTEVKGEPVADSKDNDAKTDANTEKESETKTNKQEPVNESEQASGDANEVQVDAVDNAVAESIPTTDELFNAKLESKLLRAGVREDRLDSAIKLFKLDHTIADINKVANWLKEYPEWTIQKTKPVPTPFGMGVGENEQGLTAEDRRFKELGLKD